MKSKKEVNKCFVVGSDRASITKLAPSAIQSQPRGFAAMKSSEQRKIASKGGKAAHSKGTAHEFDSEEARLAGRKGGMAVSRNREHMARIGRAGGSRPRTGATIISTASLPVKNDARCA